MHEISFPGLGIGEFTVKSEAFSLFGRGIAWYGIIITVGIICAYLYACRRGKISEGIDPDTMTDLTFFTVIIGIIGARLYYVLFKLEEYKTFYDVIAVWNGGLAIYGGIIAGALTVIVFCKIRRLNVLKFLDAACPGVMIAQAIGRWGNFMNAEAYGSETEIFCRMGIRDALGTVRYYHPTFFYESLWNVIGFVLINLFYKKKKFNGEICFAYFAWYGFGRMFIEGLRTDSLYLWHTGIRISQVVGAVCFVVGLALILVFRKIGDRFALTRLSAPAAAGTAATEPAPEDGEEAETTEKEETAEETDSGKPEEKDGENDGREN